MAIITALARARQYLIFTESATDNRLEDAVVPATREFKKVAFNYSRAKLISETFDSTAVEEYGDDYIKVTLASSVIKKLWVGYKLSVTSGTYEGEYNVLSIDTDTNEITLKIYVDFVDETITFYNEQYQIYEDSLGWLICAYTTFTHQEIKECKVMITSTQVGEASSEAYNINSIDSFRMKCRKEAFKLIVEDVFPIGY